MHAIYALVVYLPTYEPPDARSLVQTKPDFQKTVETFRVKGLHPRLEKTTEVNYDRCFVRDFV